MLFFARSPSIFKISSRVSSAWGISDFGPRWPRCRAYDRNTRRHEKIGKEASKGKYSRNSGQVHMRRSRHACSTNSTRQYWSLFQTWIAEPAGFAPRSGDVLEVCEPIPMKTDSWNEGKRDMRKRGDTPPSSVRLPWAWLQDCQVSLELSIKSVKLGSVEDRETRTAHFIQSILHFCINGDDPNQVTKFRSILSPNRRKIKIFYN